MKIAPFAGVDGRVGPAAVVVTAWTGRWAAPAVLLAAVAGGATAWNLADLSPRVEPEFFFAADDPRVQASLGNSSVGEGLGSQPVIVRTYDALGDEDAYEESVEALTEALAEVESVVSAYSIANQDARRNPVFSRMLLTGNPRATNIVLDTRDPEPERFLADLEMAIAEHESPDLVVTASGVPVLMELIRRNLFHDLVVFSLAAALVFAALVAVLYRDPAITLGALATCALSIGATLVAAMALGVSIGLLTANIVTITFVLTLSHVVFMTANWRRAARALVGERAAGSLSTAERRLALRRGVGETFEGSFWAMATTSAGFLSLLFASAKPLRELGTAGGVAAATALLVAYSVYPAFLGRWARSRPPAKREAGAVSRLDRRLAALGGPGGAVARRVVLAATALAGLLGAAGLPQLDTDPGLLTYFEADGPIRAGLEQIDADGGSSTLDLSVRNLDGARIDTDESFSRLGALQESLEADSVVGVVLSPVTMVGHARTFPLAGLAPLRTIIDIAMGPLTGYMGRAFITDDRSQGHFNLRMREGMAGEAREMVMERMSGYATAAGFATTRIGGLYHLQAELGRLIRESMTTGIAALLGFFFLVALLASRALPVALRMWACLAVVPAVVLGGFGHLGIAVDIVTSPAANVALALGVDAMIHLVVRARRLGSRQDPWGAALTRVGPPVLGATLIICTGFGIFTLSSFPPTARFGLAVALGTLVAAAMALAVLPRCVRGPAGER